MATDWFRFETWTDDDAREFRARLARARPYNRAQYLRIQAYTLANADPPLHRPAIALLDELLRDYPTPFEFSQTYVQMGQSLMALGDETGAIEAYERGIAALRSFPHRRTEAPILLALHIAEHGQSDRFEEARALLDEFKEGTEFFPVSRFERHACRALIHAARGETNEAVFQARAAIAESDLCHSGLSRHPTVGIVGHRYSHLVARIRQIADNPPSLWKRITGRAKNEYN